ncbi:disease resistance protein RPP8-like [Pyrus ussuriensis x Pyrus communis]|uniref:Disease resistance protein RPP8-like n=1 Tax=Pyrus ussuriensis x Pyrus communis TaxID=2448454 RepID=A0A5N5F0G3_9ROSA|nr:disease resistance protein RPP8-like [Pyrus ussuriensis x Pyrus communis]
MAEAVVIFVLGRVADVLAEIQLPKDVRPEILRLRDELKRMLCFLKDADAKQEDDLQVRNWVSDVRNLAYDAEDLIDTYILKVESYKYKKWNFVKRYASTLKARSKIGKDLVFLRTRISDISISHEAYGIRSTGEGTSHANEGLLKLRRSTPRGQDKDIVGLEEDIATLVALLVSEDQWRAISIVGMGGIGKTTCAKEVYNHADIQTCFDCRAWVYISQQFRTRDVLQSIIKQVSTRTEDTAKLGEDELEEMLYKLLEGRRYLIVLDDIWSTSAFDSLAKAFPNNHSGSKLFLTTRNNNVALHADAQSPPHELRFRSKEDSWKLLCRKAFTESIERMCPPQLEEIGKEIVAKCAGLPLAIVVLGGMLSRKRRLSEWQRVLNSIRALLARGPNAVSAILALSYYDLPYYLKFCFLYLGLFPEDYLFSARKLFRLWIAEGLIPYYDGRMEDLAEEYLNELIDRNMVQAARLSANDRVKHCRLHDLMRDLCISRAKSVEFLYIHSNLKYSIFRPLHCSDSRARHHAIYSGFCSSLDESTPNLRSLLFFKVGQIGCEISLSPVCRSFKLLRVLELEDVKSWGIPRAIGEMIHLKYLGLRHCSIESLPEEIGWLSNLQTLDILENVKISMVPDVLWKMKSLRHLYMYLHAFTGKLRIDTLQHLQTLAGINVDSLRGINSANLISLRKLSLTGSFITNRAEIFGSLANLLNLHSLSLESIDNFFPSLSALSCLRCVIKLHLSGGIRKLPNTHEFPPNLNQLILHQSRLENNPLEILEKLPYLFVLRLKHSSYRGKKLKFSANGFPQLEYLELEFLDSLEELEVEESAMPKLRSLQITYCQKLRMLPEEIKSLTTLQELVFEGMPRRFIDRLQGEDHHKVQHVPSIIKS